MQPAVLHVFCGNDFADAPKVHDHHAVADVLHDGRVGRDVQRRLDDTATRIHDALHRTQLQQPPLVEQALGRQASALLATLNIECANADELNSAAAEAFREHPDHRIITSFPGLGDATGAQVLAEIGDDRGRFADARGLKAFAGSAPITRASGRTTCVTHRHVKNNRLAAVGFVWPSPVSRGQVRSKPTTTAVERRATGTPPHCATSSTGSWASSITAFTPAKLSTHQRHSPVAPAHQNPLRLDSYAERRSISGPSTSPHPATPPPRIIDDRGTKSYLVLRPQPSVSRTV